MLYHVDILSRDSADTGACGRIPHFVDKEPGATRGSDLLGTQLAIGGVRARSTSPDTWHLLWPGLPHESP